MAAALCRWEVRKGRLGSIMIQILSFISVWDRLFDVFPVLLWPLSRQMRTSREGRRELCRWCCVLIFALLRRAEIEPRCWSKLLRRRGLGRRLLESKRGCGLGRGVGCFGGDKAMRGGCLGSLSAIAGDVKTEDTQLEAAPWPRNTYCSHNWGIE